MHAFHVEMRHCDTTAVGICSPELRQARKALEEARGLRSRAVPANMALPGLHRGGPYTGSWSPRGGKLGCGLSWILESTLNFFHMGSGMSLAPTYNSVPKCSHLFPFYCPAGKIKDTPHHSQALFSLGLW